MSVNRGKKHNSVGIYVSLKDDGTLQILMQEYIKERVLAFGKDMGKSSNTPARYNLFMIGESEPSGLEKAEIFHHPVVKLGYVCKMLRVDMYLAISFI